MLNRMWKNFYPTKSTALIRASGSEEAEKAKQEAEQSLKEARGRQPRVTQVVNSLEAQKEKNHFAEMIEITMRGAG